MASRYVHLFLGLVILFAVSSIITRTTPFDKIAENLKRYCYMDYEIRVSRSSGDSRDLEYYRDKYKEQLDLLSNGMFDDHRKDEAKAYFVKNGFLYEAWEEDEHRSYLLAKIVDRGVHKGATPEEIGFDYFILGKKKIVPFSEYRKGPGPKPFVSAGEKAIYLYRDSLEPLLRWYFQSLWATAPKESSDFHGDPLSYSLYRDLQEICEEIFIKRHYMNKRSAEETFVEEGFKVFLPTLLGMGARMAADRDKHLPSDYQYLRACLAGLSRHPNHTIFCILKMVNLHPHSPLAVKGWKIFLQRLELTYPDEITLQQISEMSQDILNNLEDSS